MPEDDKQARNITGVDPLNPCQGKDDPPKRDRNYPLAKVADGGECRHLFSIAAQDVGHARVSAAMVAHIVFGANPRDDHRKTDTPQQIGNQCHNRCKQAEFPVDRCKSHCLHKKHLSSARPYLSYAARAGICGVLPPRQEPSAAALRNASPRLTGKPAAVSRVSQREPAALGPGQRPAELSA